MFIIPNNTNNPGVNKRLRQIYKRILFTKGNCWMRKEKRKFNKSQQMRFFKQTLKQSHGVKNATYVEIIFRFSNS